MIMGEEPNEEIEVMKYKEKRWPPWLKPLLDTKFFEQCEVHMDSHRRECNMFCLDCINGALCSLCLSHDHNDHHTIQIRRSSYHNVIRVGELQKLLDISGVQTYVINSARVVFLNPRPQTRPPKAMDPSRCCLVCFRSLLGSFDFCCLACKIAGIDSEDNYQKTGEKGMNKSDPYSYSGSNQENGGGASVQSFNPLTPPPTVVSYQIGPMKRRKGIPHRSPFGGLLLEV